MALIAYRNDNQNYQATGAEAGRLHSQTLFSCTLIAKSDTVEVPVQVCTKVGELKEVLAANLGYIDKSSFDFVVKQGCTFRKLLDSDTVVRKMTVRGLDNFKPPRHKYKHPYGIIGAGYTGLKTAMLLSHYGSDDYIVFDRYDRVGGHAWLEMANKTTKLQTEFPTYHVWYGSEFSQPGMTKCGGPPLNHEIWPTRDQLLEHFQLLADEYGIMPHCHLQSNVAEMDIIGKVTDMERYYNLKVDPVRYGRKDVQGGGALAHQVGGGMETRTYEGDVDRSRQRYEVNVSCIAMWPGALVFPREVTYPGEADFGGPIDFAVEMRYDYRHVRDKVVCIIGHGAFTMENIRTCLEESCKHIYVLCRKINLTCPRIASWFVNQANPAISAAQMLDILAHAYKYIVVDGKVAIDPWDMHSVMANSTRTHATVQQKTRFGIGDVYFLAAAYGLMEVVIGNVKRCTYQTLHIDSGRKIECAAVLKCTGCLGDWKVDKLLRIKEMRGNYVNGDPRRVCSGEADGINASQFSLTTSGPGIYSMVKAALHFWDVPKDWERMVDNGTIDFLPVHKAGEPDEEFPAYFFTSKHAQSAGIILDSASPLLRQKMSGDGEYKHFIQMLCTPPERVLQEAKADWELYEQKFRDRGMVPKDAPYVPYPYNLEYISEQFKIHGEYLQKRWGEK